MRVGRNGKWTGLLLLSLVGTSTAESVNKECLDILEEHFGNRDIIDKIGFDDTDPQDIKLCKVFYNVKSMLRKYFKVRHGVMGTSSADTAEMLPEDIPFEDALLGDLSNLSPEEFHSTSDEDAKEASATCASLNYDNVQARSMNNRNKSSGLFSTFGSILTSFSSLVSSSKNRLTTIHRNQVKESSSPARTASSSSSDSSINAKQRARQERQRRRKQREQQKNESPEETQISKPVLVKPSLPVSLSPVKKGPVTLLASRPANEWQCAADIKNGSVEYRMKGKILRFECEPGFRIRHPQGVRQVKYRFCRCSNGQRGFNPNTCSSHILNEEQLPSCVSI